MSLQTTVADGGSRVVAPAPGGHVFLFKEIEHPKGGRPRTIAFKDVTVIPRGYEELVATQPDKDVTIKLEMRGGTIVDTDIDEIDPNGRINITTTLATPFTANSIGLVIGGWLPSALAAIEKDSAILLDRNLVTEIVSRFEQGESKGRPADFLDLLKDMDVWINPCLYAMEGCERRIPDASHVRQELQLAIGRIAGALPTAKLMVGTQSLEGIAGLIEESRESFGRNLQFLLKTAPILKSPIGRRRQDRVWAEVIMIAKDCGVAPRALVLLAALSSAVTPQSAPARGLLKFQPDYSAELAYNALCDLRAIEYLLNCTARFPDMKIQLCTRDRDLALFWTALGATSHLENDRVVMGMTPHHALFPQAYFERWNSISSSDQR